MDIQRNNGLFENETIKKALKKYSDIRLIGLRADGTEIVPQKESVSKKRKTYIPVVLDDKQWTLVEQEASADNFKDKISRIFDMEHPEKGREKSIYDDKARVDLALALKYGKNVLEFGCSDGTVSLLVSRNKNIQTVTGVDIRTSAIKDASKLKSTLVADGILTLKQAGKVSFVRGDIMKMKFPQKQFDTVCAFEVLEHIHPLQFHGIFMSLYNLVKPGGTMFITVPNRYPDSKYEKMNRHRWPWSDHKNYFTELSLRVLLEPYFKSLTFFPLYADEDVSASIYLTCVCQK